MCQKELLTRNLCCSEQQTSYTLGYNRNRLTRIEDGTVIRLTICKSKVKHVPEYVIRFLQIYGRSR